MDSCVETEYHFLFHCSQYDDERNLFLNSLGINNTLGDQEKITLLLKDYKGLIKVCLPNVQQKTGYLIYVANLLTSRIYLLHVYYITRTKNIHRYYVKAYGYLWSAKIGRKFRIHFRNSILY